jgi:hypothetical protein
LGFSSVIVIGFNRDFHLSNLDLELSGTFIIFKSLGGGKGIFLVEVGGVIRSQDSDNILDKADEFFVNDNFVRVIIGAGSLVFVGFGFRFGFADGFNFGIRKVGFDFFFGSGNNFFNKSGSSVFVSFFNSLFSFFSFFVGIIRDNFSGLVVNGVGRVSNLDKGSGGIFFFGSMDSFFEVGDLAFYDFDGFAESISFFSGITSGFFKGFGGFSNASFFSFFLGKL